MENKINSINMQEANEDLPSVKIKKIMEPYLKNITIPEDVNYTKLAREWQVEKYVKAAGYESFEDFKSALKSK